jgi:hypothetical protein
MTALLPAPLQPKGWCWPVGAVRGLYRPPSAGLDPQRPVPNVSYSGIDYTFQYGVSYLAVVGMRCDLCDKVIPIS